MDGRHPARAVEPDQEDAVLLADSLRADFTRLMAIFDRQLGARVGDKAATIADARTAAERGLRLSEELRELLAKNL